MKNSMKGFMPIAVIVIVVAVLALAGGGYWWWQNKTKVTVPVVNQQATTSQQIATSLQGVLEYHIPMQGNPEYKTVVLSDVMNYLNNYVTASGTVVFVNARTDGIHSPGPELVLADNSGHYLLIPVAHAFWNEFVPIFSKLNIGDVVQVWGRAGMTQGIPVTSSSGTRIESIGVNLAHAPYFGMIPLDGIKKLDTISAWKTYRNDEYGFEIKYPAEIELSGGKTKLSIQENRNPFDSVFVAYIEKPFNIGFQIKNKPKDFSNLKSYVGNQKQELEKLEQDSAAGFYVTVKETTVANQVAFIVSTRATDVAGNSSDDIYLERGSQLILIVYSYQAAPLEDQKINPPYSQDEKLKFDTIQKIIPTFRFTK